MSSCQRGNDDWTTGWSWRVPRSLLVSEAVSQIRSSRLAPFKGRRPVKLDLCILQHTAAWWLGQHLNSVLLQAIV